MDGITAAVVMIGQERAIQQIETVNRMIRSNEEATRGLVDMIVANASAGTLYSKEGLVQPNPAAEALDTTA